MAILIQPIRRWKPTSYS